MNAANREMVGQILLLGFAGVVWGAIAGWFGTASGDPTVAADRVMALFPWNGLVVAVLLLAVTASNVRQGARSMYAERGGAVRVALIGLAGGALAAGFWFYLATSLPAVFLADLDAGAFRETMYAHGSAWDALLVLLPPAAAGVALGVWAHRHVAGG